MIRGIWIECVDVAANPSGSGNTWDDRLPVVSSPRLLDHRLMAENPSGSAGVILLAFELGCRRRRCRPPGPDYVSARTLGKPNLPISVTYREQFCSQ